MEPHHAILAHLLQQAITFLGMYQSLDAFSTEVACLCGSYVAEQK